MQPATAYSRFSTISQETFQAILDSLGETVPPPVGREKRGGHRAAVGTRAAILLLRDLPRKVALTVTLRDLSSHGIGILHRQPMEPGEQFIICLPSELGRSRAVLYSVTRCTPAGEHRHAIGATRVRELNLRRVAD